MKFILGADGATRISSWFVVVSCLAFVKIASDSNRDFDHDLQMISQRIALQINQLLVPHLKNRKKEEYGENTESTDYRILQPYQL